MCWVDSGIEFYHGREFTYKLVFYITDAKVYFLTPRKETFLNCLMMEKSSGKA